MPYYPYKCHDCGEKFEVIKQISAIDDVEACPSCSATRTERCIGRVNFKGEGDWNQLDYHPAFGKPMTPMQASKEARRRGMIEIGNEPPDKIHKHFEKQREQKVKDTYAKL